LELGAIWLASFRRNLFRAGKALDCWIAATPAKRDQNFAAMINLAGVVVALK
jgi:hypothetical protein